MNELAIFAAIFALSSLVVILLRVAMIEKRLAALSRIDAKLDQLLKQAGIDTRPADNFPDQVMEALRRGEKIQAIKLYRESTGVGLKEAKDIVEEIQRRTGV